MEFLQMVLAMSIFVIGLLLVFLTQAMHRIQLPSLSFTLVRPMRLIGWLVVMALILVAWQVMPVIAESVAGISVEQMAQGIIQF